MRPLLLILHRRGIRDGRAKHRWEWEIERLAWRLAGTRMPKWGDGA